MAGPKITAEAGAIVGTVAPELDERLKELAGKRLGFALFIFEHGQESTWVDYVSNSEREPMLRTVEAWLRMQRGQS